MALEMECQQVYREESGVITVTVNLIESTNQKVLGRKTFQGNTKEELKDLIRPVWQDEKTKYDEKAVLLAIANAALDELEAE